MTHQTSVTVFVFFLSIMIVFAGLPSKTQKETRGDAEKLWELAIKAKGGRTKLESVETLLVTSEGEAITSSGKSYIRKRVALAVLPYKIWSYEDSMPDVFGITVSMDNYQNNTEYFWANGRKKVKAIEMSPRAKKAKAYQNSTIFYLMESRWLKPKILGIAPISSAGVNTYLIQTIVDDRRVDFELDRTTYLPTKIVVYEVGIDGVSRNSEMNLMDYVEVDGIKVPQRTQFESQLSERTKFGFNVDYNPSIFERAPENFDAMSWKPK